MNPIPAPIPPKLPAPAGWTETSASAAASRACSLIPPLWPLRHFVAVNPFLGFSGRTFRSTCEHFAKVIPGGMLMDPAYYRGKIQSGAITADDLDAALARAREIPLHSGDVLSEPIDGNSLPALFNTAEETSGYGPVLATFSETIDELQGTRWSGILVESVTDFCAGWFDEGQSPWRLAPVDGSRNLFQAWKEHAGTDLQPELVGLAGFREKVAALPETAAEALAESLGILGIDPAIAPAWLHRVLLTIRGWAGYLQYQVRSAMMNGARKDDQLIELLAIRVACEAIACRIAGPVPGLSASWPPSAEGHEEGRLSTRVVSGWLALLADEHAWERRMRKALASSNQSNPAGQTDAPRPAVQAVFCIDVRSEVFRRALESASPGIRTSGFAGFFGLPIEYQPLGPGRTFARCPVLLSPSFHITECHHDPGADAAARRRHGLNNRLSHGWNAFKTSAISCFSFVETAGLLFGGALLRDGFAGKHRGPSPTPGKGPSIGSIHPADRITLAGGILKNLGLTDGFARLVLLCGHGSETTNNPYGSGLDCGACGGHAGDANARVAAALLNDPAVREGLAAERAINIPGDTWFLGGLHNTTTDEVILFDLEAAPPTHRGDIASLNENLKSAGRGCRRERAALLGISPDDEHLDQKVLARARDWSQVRPEWGLAGNAAFVAAPRSRTRNADLGGRVFLHDYDWRKDPDNGVLTLIMTAPMVVANWINLQYYASTVNNAAFGSGNKVLHNVVGTIGVCLGNQGDLQTGLPLQSVHDGTRHIHEPLRLHVFLEAPRERIEEVVAAHANVRDLVDHQWLHLFAIDEAGQTSRRRPGGGWENPAPTRPS